MKDADRGFSLLELLVAFAIMAIGLAMVYRSTGGSARQVHTVSMQQRAQVLAASLLSIEAVPEAGVNEAGESAGLQWTVRSELYVSEVTDLRAIPLHQLLVTVRWDDALAANGQRFLELATIRPQRGLVKPRLEGRS